MGGKTNIIAMNCACARNALDGGDRRPNPRQGRSAQGRPVRVEELNRDDRLQSGVPEKSTGRNRPPGGYDAVHGVHRDGALTESHQEPPRHGQASTDAARDSKGIWRT